MERHRRGAFLGRFWHTQAVTFVDQDGWKLSRSSASTVLAIFG